MKTIKTIHLVQVTDVFDTNIILPLAIGMLWAHAIDNPVNKEKWRLGKVIYKKIDDTEIAQLAVGDIVCFSNYIWNSTYHIELARKIKKINPTIFILVGGPSIVISRKEFWLENKDCIDLAIVGEGDQAFDKILSIWPTINIQEIPGAWTQDYFNGDAPRITNLAQYSSPYLIGFYDPIVRLETGNGMKIQAVIQTNRGCPYSCTFCESGTEYKTKLFFYDIVRIKQEIEWCAKNKIEFLSIADDNWGIAERDIEVMRWIRDCKLKYGYPKIIDATYAKNAPDRVLKIASIDSEHKTELIRAVTMALQSSNISTLSTIKRFNLIPNKQVELIKGLNSLGVPTYTELIWPLPHETYKSFLSGIDNNIQMGLTNWLDVHPLSLWNGTQLYEDIIDHVKLTSDKKDQLVYVGLVKETNWVDADTVIRGNVFYSWLVCLYFFGFSRSAIKKYSKISDFVDKFLNWAKQNPKSKIGQYHTKVVQWWDCMFTNSPIPDVSIFKDRDTRYWKSYTHLASWIQDDIDGFYRDLQCFVDSINLLHNVDQDKQSVVVFDHQQEFNNLFEFSRYHYWWKRKGGTSRIKTTPG